MLAAGAFTFRNAYRTLRILRDRTNNAWAELRALLADRHLVVTHLIDATEQRLSGRSKLGLLEWAHKQAQVCLEKASEDLLTAADLDAISQSERRLSEILGKTMTVLHTHRGVAHAGPIRGCVEGIQSLERKLLLARVAYNDAATTYTAYASSAPISWITRLLDYQESYQLIDWGFPLHNQVPIRQRSRAAQAKVDADVDV